MIGRLLLLGAILGLAACAAPPPPDRPDCAAPLPEDQTDGGIGGTGNADDPCARP